MTLASTARPLPRCPKPGCTQHVSVDTNFDPDYVRCLYHGHVFVGQVPEMEPLVADSRGHIQRRTRGVGYHAGSRL